MRLTRVLLLVVAATLPACAVYPLEPAPVAPVSSPANPRYVRELEKFRAEVAESKRKYPDQDKTAETVLRCQQLFARGSDGERLCLMRGMDRYVDHLTPPLSERYLTRQDEISVQVPRPAPEPARGVQGGLEPRPGPVSP